MKKLYKIIGIEMPKDNSMLEWGGYHRYVQDKILEEFSNYYSSIKPSGYNGHIGRMSISEIEYSPKKSQYVFKLFSLDEKYKRVSVLEEMNLIINFY